MRFSRSPLAAGAAALLATAGVASAQNTTTCATGVHLIVARGSDEPPGPGRLNVTVDGIEAAIPGSTLESVDYPATFTNYGNSVADGVVSMEGALERYTQECPDSKVVLMGFSQGAHVTLNLLCGSSEESDLFTQDNPPFNQATVNHSVIAVVAYGDPTHTLAAPWNEGNSTNNGLFARQNLTACLPYAPIIRSWCDQGDRYCDLGNNSITHGSYFRTKFNETIDFVVERYENATGKDVGTPTSSGSPSGTAEPSASATGTEDSAAGAVFVSWGVLAVAAVAGLANL